MTDKKAPPPVVEERIEDIIDVPNPGSQAAVSAGCTCARMDNAHGKGYRFYDDGRPPVFVISAGCPLHDKGEKQDEPGNTTQG